MSQPLYGRRSDPHAAPGMPATVCAASTIANAVIDVRPVCCPHGSSFDLCGLRGQAEATSLVVPERLGLVRSGMCGSRRTPLITYATIILCIGLWLGDFVSNHVVTRYLGFTPLYGLIQPWRIFDDRISHLNHPPGFNMISLYAVG